ncbi:MAG TPA: amidohydrolase family protein [Nitrospirota bacterium]
MIIIVKKLIDFGSHGRIIENGAIAVNRGKILYAGPAGAIIKRYPRHEIMRFPNAVIMPGLVNLHTHLELPPLLDLIRARTYTEWVLNLIKIKRELGAKDYTLAVNQNIRTLIRTGTTTVAEICTHNISPKLLKQSGLRAMIYHEIISMDPSSLVTRLSSFVFRPSSLVHHGISPHAPHTVSAQMLHKIKEISDRKKLHLCMHVAESKDEIRLLQGKRSGLERLYAAANWDKAWAPSAQSSFEYLHRVGLLDTRFLAAHAVQTADNDIRLMKKTRVPVAHCPRSNKELGVGRMPLKKILDEGIIVGLGTDSLASAPSLSMWDEMRYACQIHRRDGITPKDVFNLATMGVAHALGLDKEIGSLESGRRADIIAVPLPAKNTGNIYSDLLRGTKSCIMTMVNGKILHMDRSRENE